MWITKNQGFPSIKWTQLRGNLSNRTTDWYSRMPSGRWFCDLYQTGDYLKSDSEFAAYQTLAFTPDPGWSGGNTHFWSLRGYQIYALFHQIQTGTRQRKLYRSVDNGETWTYIMTVDGWSFGGEHGGHPFLKLDDGSLLLASDGSARIARSTDDGSTWTTVMTPVPLDAPYSGLAAKPGGTVVSGHKNNGFRVSYDYGQTWASRDMPGGECQVLNFLPDGYLYVGIRGYPPVLARRQNVAAANWSGGWELSALVGVDNPWFAWTFSHCVNAPWGGILVGLSNGYTWWTPEWGSQWQRLHPDESYDATNTLIVVGGMLYVGKFTPGLYKISVA